jgi:hypothetical protein
MECVLVIGWPPLPALTRQPFAAPLATAGVRLLLLLPYAATDFRG